MKSPTFRITALATATALLAAFGAMAQSGGDRGAAEQELQAARAQLRDAAERVARLSRELGLPGGGPVIIHEEVLRRPVVGVLLEPDGTAGVGIAGVTPDGGAAAAGLRAGDRLLSVDGKAITGADAPARLRSARALLGGLKAGQSARLGYERDGRRAEATVTAQAASPVTVFDGDAGRLMPRGNVVMRVSREGDLDLEADSVEIAPGRDAMAYDRAAPAEAPRAPGVAREIHREIIRMGPGEECPGGRCEFPALSEALRWNGLNLASVDARLGRYFGTDRGVLVLSTGPDLAGLQAGDVIRSVAGQPVRTPRELMDRLRGRAEGAQVDIGYVRDRKAASTRIRVPEAAPLPLPPPPPAPPAPRGGAAPAAPPAPPAPPSPAVPPPPPTGLAVLS